MANELQAFLGTGLTTYCILLNENGRVWNGVNFVAINSANWTDYDIPLTESAAGIYFGNMPVIGQGGYRYIVYSQEGVAPDITDSIKGYGYLIWDGSASVPLSDLVGGGWSYESLVAIYHLVEDMMPPDPMVLP